MAGKITKNLSAALCALTLITARAAALELSLEENKGESGTVGYVDIDRVFKEYSGTLAAREEFLGEIKRKEGSVNQRKHEVFSLKADISKLRQEREFAMTLPSLFATADSINAAAQPAPAADAPAAEPASSTAATETSAVQERAAAPSTAQPAAGLMNIPPADELVSTAAAARSEVPALSAAVPPAAQPEPVKPDQEAAAPAAAPAQAAAPVQLPPGLPGIDMPGISKVPVSYFKFSVSTSVPEIDAAISAKETELRNKEDALKLYQRQIERELLEYESHKSEILLGRIYIALKELAIREGVSVIVDKRSILFGHSAVDLTDPLLSALEEGQ
jgi:Skp family chaperone for outer membrane proteins